MRLVFHLDVIHLLRAVTVIVRCWEWGQIEDADRPFLVKNPNNKLSHSTSQESVCAGSNMASGALPHVPSGSTNQTQVDAPTSFTPTLVTHFDENLIKHIQGWPSENTEKQVQLC